MTGWAKKRFWKDANLAETKEGFAIQLDGRPLKTPAKADLLVPTQALAQEIAEEWRNQPDEIDPGRMPLTRSANSAIDKVTPQFNEVAEIVAEYGDSDLICYRATSPDVLVARQAEAWDPLVAWAAKELNAPLEVASGVIHVSQAEKSRANLRAEVKSLDPFLLTALHDLVAISGSLVIGLAAIRRWEAPESLWARSRVDEAWQTEQWGEDEEASAVESRKFNDFLTAHKFFELSFQRQ